MNEEDAAVRNDLAGIDDEFPDRGFFHGELCGGDFDSFFGPNSQILQASLRLSTALLRFDITVTFFVITIFSPLGESMIASTLIIMFFTPFDADFI